MLPNAYVWDTNIGCASKKRTFAAVMKKYARLNYLLATYVAAIVYFTLFRVVETVVYGAQTEGGLNMDGLYWRALVMGWRFDTVVCCYALALPALALLVGEFARIKSKVYYKVVHYFDMVVFTVCFFACAADIPYFCYFFSRLDVVALSWADSPKVVLDMIVSEPSYVVFFLVFVVVAVSWWLLMKWLLRKLLLDNIDQYIPLKWSVPLAVVLVFAMFVGMRGRLSKKSPIRVGTASFCGNAFLNQIGLNPVFTFLKSAEELTKEVNREVAFMSADEALQVVDEMRNAATDTLGLPVVSLSQGTNVVLVIMESMTVEKTSLGEDAANSLTPNLDSLMRGGLLFSQIYSAGIHTYNGIYSTLYSHPAILARHTMKHATMPKMCGLPQVLEENGYQTAYFMTHDEDFDNMRGFLFNNGFQHIFGQHSYPQSEVVGTWGVPDHVMFDHALAYCNAIAEDGPFFTCIMTCSDHSPYVFPDGIDLKPRHDEIGKKMVEYADWAIGRFMNEAAKQAWFTNTVFVFVADHGASGRPLYEISLPYNHIPLLYYSPRDIRPCVVSQPGCQIDAAPTLISMLPVEWKNNTLGVDMLRVKRPYAYFSADDKVGVVDDEWLYIYNCKQEKESLFDYKNRSTRNVIDSLPDKALAMRRYALGMIQHSQQMLLEKTTGCK